jgi:hypothetical protein
VKFHTLGHKPKTKDDVFYWLSPKAKDNLAVVGPLLVRSLEKYLEMSVPTLTSEYFAKTIRIGTYKNDEGRICQIAVFTEELDTEEFADLKKGSYTYAD